MTALGSITIFNKHQDYDASWCDEVVSIMRPNILGNLHPVTPRLPRAEAIRLFDKDLADAMKSDTPQRREIERLAGLVARGGNVALLCCCTPQPCHGDVVKRVVADRARAINAVTLFDASRSECRIFPA